MLMFLMAFAILAEAQTFRSPNKKIQLSIDTNSAKTTQLKIDYVGKNKQRQHVLDVSALGITQQGVSPSHFSSSVSVSFTPAVMSFSA